MNIKRMRTNRILFIIYREKIIKPMELCKKKEVSSEPASYQYLFGYTKMLCISSLMREEFEDKSLFLTRRRISIRREEENEDRKRNKSVSFLKNIKIRGEILHPPLKIFISFSVIPKCFVSAR